MEEQILGDKKVCYACDSSETWIDKRNGKPSWIYNKDKEDNVICSRCYDSIFRNKGERRIQKQMEYYAHQKRAQQKQIAYYHKNKELIKERRKYYKISPETKLNNAVGQARRRYEIRMELIELLGPTCVKCGYNKFKALQLDHKRGIGSKEYTEIFKSYMGMLRYYRDHPDEALKYLQVLCANCNIIKKYENMEIRNYFDVI